MSHQGSIPASASRFMAGQKVRINNAAYRTWYEENVPYGVFLAEEDDIMTVIDPNINGLVHVRLDGSWGAGVPSQFLEVVA